MTIVNEAPADEALALSLHIAPQALLELLFVVGILRDHRLCHFVL